MLSGAEALGAFGNEFYAGMPAVTKNRYGKGTAYYVAFVPDQTFISDFTDPIIKNVGLQPDLQPDLPHGVLVRKRGDLTFVMNFTDREKSFTLKESKSDHFTGEIISDLSLPPFGYAVLR